MYAPNPSNLHKMLIDFPRGGTLSLYSIVYNTAPTNNILLPDSGYILTPSFSLIYDISRVDDGTIYGNNDAQIILINFVLDYLAHHVKDFSALSYIFSDTNFLNVYTSNNIELKIPVVGSNFQPNKFLVGRRAKSFVTDPNNPIPDANPDGEQIFRNLQILADGYHQKNNTQKETEIDYSSILQTTYTQLDFPNCYSFFDVQFTLAIGNWKTLTSSGWRPSNGHALVSVKHVGVGEYPDYYSVHQIVLDTSRGGRVESSYPFGLDFAIIDATPEELNLLKSAGVTVVSLDKFYFLKFENERNVGGWVMQKSRDAYRPSINTDPYLASRAYLFHSWEKYIEILSGYNPKIYDILSYPIDWYKIIIPDLGLPYG